MIPTPRPNPLAWHCSLSIGAATHYTPAPPPPTLCTQPQPLPLWLLPTPCTPLHPRSPRRAPPSILQGLVAKELEMKHQSATVNRLKQQLGTARQEVRVRVRVTELKYVVLEPVYQIIRPPGWSLRV